MEPSVDTATDEEFTQSLQYISTDSWFTRTWILQERQCATSLKLLVSIDTTVHIPEDVREFMVGNDVCLDIYSLNEAMGLRIAIDPDYYWNKPDVKTAYDKMLTLLGSIRMPRPEEYSMPESVLTHRFFQFLKLMTLCDNLVTADRISIFANACGFPYHLLSNRLDRPDISYVTCMVVLMLANLFPSIEEGKQMIARDWNVVPSYNLFANTFDFMESFPRRYTPSPGSACQLSLEDT
ncbi:uncharacterized protein ALTATR162_LOCUS85 [Alternaria atra]|uniref:Heterokaryon incompatibility domain-containing protein n=1 Tax=Alternaria atra TaxID=119953 RepID=A0A8J2HRC3_9PLEO|nr:uncharacterized protein ALTATR162_LOCUS85 [Alternaria atra]CAG5137393.1 unnamed protein product [Alternaria atra]